jgi:hypothetical protein
MSGSAGASGEQSPEATRPTVSSGFINIDYARVSTLNLDVQMRALRKTGCKKSFGSNKLRMPCPRGPVYLS